MNQKRHPTRQNAALKDYQRVLAFNISIINLGFYLCYEIIYMIINFYYEKKYFFYKNLKTIRDCFKSWRVQSLKKNNNDILTSCPINDIETNDIRIPKIIHQIWIGPLPAPKFMHTWKDIHPDYEYLLWNNERIKELFPLVNQHLYDLYEHNDEAWSARSDILRFEIMYRYGGIYVDADTICLRHLEGDFLDKDFFAAYINEKIRKDRIATGVMGGIKGHPLIKHCIEELNTYKKTKRPAALYLGPAFFTDIVKKYNFKIYILPSYYFYPKFYKKNYGADYVGDFKPFGDHLWGNTKKIYGKI
jgi:mannosyltransferase OCH1-like enzyme